MLNVRDKMLKQSGRALKFVNGARNFSIEKYNKIKNYENTYQYALYALSIAAIVLTVNLQILDDKKSTHQFAYVNESINRADHVHWMATVKTIEPFIDANILILNDASVPKAAYSSYLAYTQKRFESEAMFKEEIDSVTDVKTYLAKIDTNSLTFFDRILSTRDRYIAKLDKQISDIFIWLIIVQLLILIVTIKQGKKCVQNEVPIIGQGARCTKMR